VGGGEEGGPRCKLRVRRQNEKITISNKGAAKLEIQETRKKHGKQKHRMNLNGPD